MIHYHGTPLTPADDMARAFATRHAMVSYEHPRQIEVCAEIWWRIQRLKCGQMGEESPTEAGCCAGHNCTFTPPRFCA